MSAGFFFSATLRAVPETQQASRGRIGGCAELEPEVNNRRRARENEALFFVFFQGLCVGKNKKKVAETAANLHRQKP